LRDESWRHYANPAPAAPAFSSGTNPLPAGEGRVRVPDIRKMQAGEAHRRAGLTAAIAGSGDSPSPWSSARGERKCYPLYPALFSPARLAQDIGMTANDPLLQP